MLKIRLKIQERRYKKYKDSLQDKISRQVRDSSAWSILARYALKFFVIIFFGGLILFPFFYMISSSLMSNSEAMSASGQILPHHGLHWENFTNAFEEGYWSALLVTLLVTAVSIVLKLLFSMTMGYAYSYKKWWGKKPLWYFFIALMMVPEVALIVGQYRLISHANLNVGWAGVVAMVLPFAASIFSAFMFRNAFETIPDRTKEAAYTDGANEFTYFVKIAIPMITPTVWTVVILTAFGAWNSYMWPAMITASDPEAKQVMTTWLFTTGYDHSDPNTTDPRLFQNIRMAASILVMLPMLITYFVFRTRIMRAISRQGSAIKG